MSAESRVKGTLTFESSDDLDDLLDQLHEDDELAEHAQDILAQTQRAKESLTFDLHVHLSNDANLWLQEWLTDLVEEASGGHLDAWQEAFGDSMYVRLTAGSDDEEEIAGPFPE